MSRPSRSSFPRPRASLLILALGAALLVLAPTGAMGAPVASAPPRVTGSVPPLDAPSAQLAAARASLPASSPPTVPAGVPSVCADVHQANYMELDRAQRVLDERCAYAEARASVSQPHWSLATGNPPSFYLYDFVLTFDASDGYVLLFGDPILPSASAPSETWRYIAGNWTELPGAGGPTSCLSSAVADDPTDGYVVYFAGTTLANGSACPSAGETWEFHAGYWQELFPSPAPSPRWGASFTNDSADNDLLLFGGASARCGGGVCNDTWTFSGGTWTQVTPSSSPSNRSSAGMTYDGADGYVLLFGGETVNNISRLNPYSMLNDTWKFQGRSWTQLSPATSPPQPAPDGLAFDPADGYAVYTQICANFSYSPSSFAEQTWEFHAGDWAPIGDTNCWDQSTASAQWPTERLGEGTTFDAADGYFVMFGGGGPNWNPEYSPDLNDTWSLHDGNWTDRTATAFTALPNEGFSVIADPSEGGVVLFGGGSVAVDSYIDRNATWEYASGAWTNISTTVAPSPRSGAGFAFDAADGYAVLFGGSNGTKTFNDTWEFLAGVWTRLTPASSPPASTNPNMVYDASDGYIVLFGGGSYPDTWTFHAGVWTNITSTAGAPSTTGYLPNPLAFDSSDGLVVDFGTYVLPSYRNTNQTWTFHAGSWTNVTASAGVPPSARQGAVFADMGLLGGAVLFSGSAATGGTYLSDTWQFEGGTWNNLTDPIYPTPRVNAAFVFDPALEAGILFGGQSDSYPYSNLYDLWTWSEGAQPFLAALRGSGRVVDEGAAVDLVTTVLGGTAPFSYAYQGLPAGCGSANASSLDCVPSTGAAGRYSIQVLVTDANGNETAAQTELQVVVSPRVASFFAAPSSVTVGNETVLRTTVSGGIAPYEYAYLGLPPGCAGQTVPALPCSPSAGGNYSIVVNVSDADGEWSVADLTLPVGPVVAGSLSVTAFSASPAQFILGNTTSLNVTASTTQPPLRYSFSGLPTGCTSANTRSLACTPTVAGTYAVRVDVTDAAADHASLGTDLTVYPVGSALVPRILSFGVRPAAIALGATVLVYLVASGGNGTLSYGYDGLPAGCVSADVVALTCRPTALGTFDIALTVTDSAGHAQVAHATLNVSAAPGPSSSGTRPSTFPDWTAWAEGLLVSGAIVAAAVLAFAAHARARRVRNFPPKGGRATP